MIQENIKIESKEEANIIDIIMANASSIDANKISGNDKQTAVEPKLITNTNFFTDENPAGIMSKSGFLKHVYGMTANQLIAFKTLFEQLTRGEKINASPYQKLDSQNNQYVWVSNLQPKGDLSYKVLTTEKLYQLIGIYQFEL